MPLGKRHCSMQLLGFELIPGDLCVHASAWQLRYLMLARCKSQETHPGRFWAPFGPFQATQGKVRVSVHIFIKLWGGTHAKLWVAWQLRYLTPARSNS